MRRAARLGQGQRLQAPGDRLMPSGEPRSSIDQLIGARIRKRRMMLGLSQRQFAELLGVASQQVYKYERGINRLSAGQIYEIAQGSGTPVEYFFEGLVTKLQLLPRQRMLLDVMLSLGEVQDKGQKAAIGQLVRALSRVGRPARRAYRRNARSQS
jgi:transcriptional regulator with XRE-family HTH domain